MAFEQGYAYDLQIKDYQGKAVNSQLSEIVYYQDGSIEKANLHFTADNMPAMGLKTYYLNPTQKQEDKSGRPLI